MTGRPGSKWQEELELFLAQKAIIPNVTFQRQCLRELYQELKSSQASGNNGQQGAADLKAKQKLEDLKAIIQGNSSRKNPDTPFRSLDSHIVMIRFEAEKKPFFDIRRRWNKYPVGNTFFTDNNPQSELVRYSEAIYDMILKAINEEGTTSSGKLSCTGESHDNDNNNTSSSSNNNNNSAANAQVEKVVQVKMKQVVKKNDKIELDAEQRLDYELQQEEDSAVVEKSEVTSPRPAADIDGAGNLSRPSFDSSIPPTGEATTPAAADAADKPASSGENDEVPDTLVNPPPPPPPILDDDNETSADSDDAVAILPPPAAGAGGAAEKPASSGGNDEISVNLANPRIVDSENLSLSQSPSETKLQALQLLPAAHDSTTDAGQQQSSGDDASEKVDDDHRPSADSEAENESESTEIVCPECSLPLEDGQLQEHQRWHFNNKTLHCKAAGCEAFAAGFKLKAHDHVRKVHQSEDYERYIVNRAVATAGGAEERLADDNEQLPQEKQEEEDSAEVAEKSDEVVTSPRRRPPADSDGAVAILPPPAASAGASAEKSASSDGESDEEEFSLTPPTLDDDDNETSSQSSSEVPELQLSAQNSSSSSTTAADSQQSSSAEGDEASDASDASSAEEGADTQAVVEVTPTKKKGAAPTTTTEGKLAASSSRVVPVKKRSAEELDFALASSQPGQSSPKRPKKKATAACTGSSTTFRTPLGGSSTASTSSAAANRDAVARPSQQHHQQQQQNHSISNFVPPPPLLVPAPPIAPPIALEDVTSDNVEAYLRANCPAYRAASLASTKVQCPHCQKFSERRLLANHLLSVHRRLKPFQCRWPGCSFAAAWRCSANRHVLKTHGSSDYNRYVVFM